MPLAVASRIGGIDISHIGNIGVAAIDFSYSLIGKAHEVVSLLEPLVVLRVGKIVGGGKIENLRIVGAIAHDHRVV